MTKIIFSLVVFFWISLHTSQSLIDLADFLLIATAFWIAVKGHSLSSLLKSFKEYYLWPAWLSVVIFGFVFGAPTEAKTALKLLWEFRWFISFTCFIYLFKKLSWNERNFKPLFLVLFIFSLLDFLLFFVNYDKDPRAGGLFGHSMPFAHTMGPSALFLLFLGWKKSLEPSQKWIWRALYFLTPAFASLMVVLSFTRGVWIGFTLGLLVGATFLGRRVLGSALLALSLIGTGLFIGSDRIQNRVMGKTNAESQSNNERLLYWKANFQMFKDHPWVGIGYSQNNVHVKDYLQKDGIEWLGGAHAHNQYIHFLAGTGALGLGCFLIFLLSIFYRLLHHLLRLKKQNPLSDHYYFLIGIFAALMCFVIGALTESNFSISKNRFVFLFLAAIGYALSTVSYRNAMKE